MADQDQDVISEFLVESYENLTRLDQELVELEKRPKDAGLLASVFRTIHTIKGTCGFLGFTTLERITHQAENLLSQLRDGRRQFSPSIVTLILDTVDATRKVLTAIEANGEEGPDRFESLTERLRAAAQAPAGEEPKAAEAREEHEFSEEAAKSSAVADANIRVAVGLLDTLMDLVGELVLTRNQILTFNMQREDPALNATSQRLNLITTELQEGVMKTRMQPIGMVWNKLPRVVRDIAVGLGKQIRVEMDGAETELDRSIIEAIKDPLVHLVRNSCDHGIEPAEARLKAGKPAEGKLTLRAYHEGGQVNIEIGDDGAGIDVARVKQKAVEKGLLRLEQAEKLTEREALNLLFLPGFSTAKTITNVSGRGVGMDVVKSNIEKIGGVVDISSHHGEGSTVKLKIPLTLAIIPGLVISSGNYRSAPRSTVGTAVGERFIIPQVSLVELIRLDEQGAGGQIEHVHGTPVYRRRGSLLPLAYLNDVLGLPVSSRSSVVNIVVLQAEDRQFGLVVDSINDTQEIVVKPLSKQLKGLAFYAGATIMGDGRVALILDVLGIGQRSGVLTEAREPAHAAGAHKAQAASERQRLLLFRAGTFERLAIPLSLVARLEEFPLSFIERAGGRQVVQYRGRILPLVPLREVLESGAPDSAAPADPAQVIVFNDGDRSVGMIVDQILDVAEEAVTVRQKTSRPGLLGSGVVGKHVADFLDLNHVIHSYAADWLDGSEPLALGRRVLVAEASAFSRGLIRSSLDMAGYQVVEAANLEEAMHGLERQTVHVVVTALNLPPQGSGALLEAMRRRPEWRRTPVLTLTESAEQRQAQASRAIEASRGFEASRAFEDCQVKFDREAMLDSISRLASAVEPEPVLAGGEGRP